MTVITTRRTRPSGAGQPHPSPAPSASPSGPPPTWRTSCGWRPRRSRTSAPTATAIEPSNDHRRRRGCGSPARSTPPTSPPSWPCRRSATTGSTTARRPTRRRALPCLRAPRLPPRRLTDPRRRWGVGRAALASRRARLAGHHTRRAPRRVRGPSRSHPPVPGPDELRVRVLAAAVSLPDVMMCRGAYAFSPDPPVHARARRSRARSPRPPAGSPFAIGDRVMAVTRFDAGAGGFADEALVRTAERLPGARRACPTPTPPASTSRTPPPGTGSSTAGALTEGEWLAVLGAAGGTGAAAVQLGHALGAHVVAVVGDERRATIARHGGAGRSAPST